MSIPKFGLGTFRLKNQVVIDSMSTGLEQGHSRSGRAGMGIAIEFCGDSVLHQARQPAKQSGCAVATLERKRNGSDRHA